MTIKQPFAPRYGATVALTAGTIAAIAIVNPGNKQWRIANKGAVDIHVRGYTDADGAQTATAADFPVLAGQTSTITVSEKFDRMSYVTATGTSSGFVTPGEGW